MTEQPTDEPVIDVVELRARQRSRSRITGVGLLLLVVLFYLITMAKVGLAH